VERTGIGQDEFKDMMSAVAASVTVVTAYADDEPIGITVSAFTSVSVDPPIVLVCIDKVAASLDAYLTADGFTVNFLPATAIQEAALFATKGLDRFDIVPWREPSVGGAGPVLEIAYGAFECETVERLEMGDHWVLFGRVDAGGRTDGLASPLLYFSRAYASVAEFAPDA
jgi:flavin reductase (DIM6/NTAB) family NADH-FMN oxidoreductase RutF